MQFPAAAFDAALLKLMSLAFDDACREVSLTALDAPEDAKTLIAIEIMRAAGSGERNAQRLKRQALRSFFPPTLGLSANE